MNILKPLLLGVFVLTLCATANAQAKKSTTEKVLNTTGKATVIIVGQAAKITYQTAKFTGREFVKPIAIKIAKPLVLKVVPKATVFLIKKAIPVGQKLFVTYLKTRLSL
jgi:hypothetical protein